MGRFALQEAKRHPPEPLGGERGVQILALYGFVGVEGTGAGALGNGVLRTGDSDDEERFRAKPVLGQRSKRVVTLRNTLEPLTVPRESRSVLEAPEPVSIDRKL